MFKDAVGRHDDEHRVGPRRQDQRRADEPAPVISQDEGELFAKVQRPDSR